MGGECFNCAGGSVAGLYTLVLADRDVIEEKPLCEPCATGFRDVDWIDVRETTRLASSRDGDRAEESP